MSMRRSVTFASQPQLEDRTINESCLPAADLLNLRLAHQQATEAKTGFMNRIRGIFSRTTSSNKGSTISLGEQKGLKAALRSHMGMFSRLIPSSETASCNALYNNPSTLKPMQKLSMAKSGTDIDVTPIELHFLNDSVTIERPSSSVGEIGKYIKVPETKVNFQLPVGRRPSIAIVQPTLRERVRGSPRFPHRVIPTCSLSALEETDDRGNSPNKTRANLNQASASGNWKSMEVAPKSTISLDDPGLDQIFVLPDNSP